ncbi:MAG: hypothetical protein ACLVL2_25740 [Bacteroides cellulosilyticus]
MVTQAGNIFAPDTDQQVLRLGASFTNRGAGSAGSFDFKVSVQKGIDWVEVPSASKEGRLLARIEREQDRKSACLPTDGQYQ